MKLDIEGSWHGVVVAVVAGVIALLLCCAAVAIVSWF